MKLKIKLQVSIILTIILAITVGLSIYMAFQSVKEGSRTEIIAAEIVKGIAELKIITHEYLLHPGERSMMQWQSRYDSLIKTITAAEFKRPSDRIILNEILQDLSRFKAAFTELFRSYGIVQEFGGPKIAFSPDLRNRLTGELLVKSQATVSPAFQLEKAIQTELVTAQQRASFLIVIFLIIFTVLIMAISLWINRSIGVPIAQLERGTQIIGAGNLDHKIGTVAKDEIGQLSRAFDKMTGDLKKTTTSINELNKEIAERKLAEEALRESEDKYRTILESIEDGYFEVDIAGNFTFFNNSLCEILGYPKDEVMGMNNRQYTDKENAKKLYQTFNKVYTTGKPDKGLDWEIIKKEGTKNHVEASVSLMKDAGDKPIGFRGIVRDITDRKQAEETLREAEQDWRDSFNSLEDVMLIIDRDYNIENINDNGLELLKKSKDDVIGKKCYQIIHGTETPAEYCPFRKAVETKKPESIERYEDIFDRHFSIKSSPIFDENGEIVRFVDLISDITERKQAEEKFEIQRAQIKSLFDYSGEAMALLDLENHIIDANLAFEEVFGYPLEEAHGKVIEDLICPERFYHTEAKELNRQAMQGIKGAEIIRMRKDGKEINVRVTAGPIKVGGTITGRFVVLDDITERKQAEQASRKAAALETLIQGYDNFIGDSLSNLLTPIYGHIELCEMGDSIDEIKGELGDIKGGITRLLTGINAYRNFSKAGESSLGKISSVDISSMLDPFLSGQPLKTYGDKEFPIDPKVKLQFTYNPKKKGALSLDKLPSVSGSKLTIATALKESLINAVESYAPKKGGDVVVSARREDGNLIIQIADNGRGMSNEDRDKSQLPFFKILGIKGSARLGLGAYIARQSAKYCGGDIHIESREGVGTTTSISFKISDDVS